MVGAAAVTLIEGAARDLENFNEEILTAGHWPSWSLPELPDGLALCVGCWRLITAAQLGVDRCLAIRRGRPSDDRRLRTHVTPRKEREKLAEYLK